MSDNNLIVLPDYIIDFLEECKLQRMNVETAICTPLNEAVDEYFKKKANRDTFTRAWVSEGYIEERNLDDDEVYPIELGKVYEIENELYLIAQVKTKKILGYLAIPTERKRNMQGNSELINIVYPDLKDLDEVIERLGKRDTGV